VRVYLMRHGQAQSRNSPDCPPDPDRRLTEEGIDRTRQAARGLACLDVVPDLVLTSPYLRSRQTAEIAVAVLGLKASALLETQALTPAADPGQILTELRRRNPQQALCIGHLPHLDSALSRMLGLSSDVTSLKKAGVACVDLPVRGHGTLVWLATPRLLRRLHA
jgi:phosphohistidine phosphatase